VDRACRQHGLKAQWFEGPDLKGKPTVSRLEANAKVQWLGDRSTSARWTGYLKAPDTGDYRFRVLSENGYRVWVGGKLVVDEWDVADSPSILSGVTRLQKGHRYPIKIEAFQSGARGDQKLVWSPPSQNGDDAVALARQADLVVFVGGLSARIEGEEMKL
jgi:beta-glucosidase